MNHTLRVVFFPSLYETYVPLDKAPGQYIIDKSFVEILQRASVSWPIKRLKEEVEGTVSTKSNPWSFSLRTNDSMISRQYVENIATFQPLVHDVPVIDLLDSTPSPQESSFLLLGDRIAPNYLVIWGCISIVISKDRPVVESLLPGFVQVWMTDVTREKNRIVSRKTLRYGLSSVSAAWRYIIDIKAANLLDVSFLFDATSSAATSTNAQKYSVANNDATIESAVDRLNCLGPSPTRDQLAKVLLSDLDEYIIESSGVMMNLSASEFDSILARHFSELYQWTVASRTKEEQSKRLQISRGQLVGRMATFALLLYPYYYYDRALLEVAAARWLPRSIKDLAAVLDNKHPLPRPLGHWTTLAINAFLERVLLPIISSSLDYLKGLFDLAASDCQIAESIEDNTEGPLTELVAQRLVRYIIASNSAISNFGDNVYEVLKRLSKGGPAVMVLRSKLLNKNVEQADERPFLVNLLAPLAFHLRSVVLEKTVLSVADGQQIPRMADAILDIEDFSPEFAPDCIRQRIHRFMDPIAPWEHEERLTLNSELVTVVATRLRVGLTRHETHTVYVPDQDKRRQVYAYVMNIYERLNRERSENIRLKRKVGTHDYGPVLKATLDGFIRNPSGDTYSRKCACAPNAPDSYSCSFLVKHKGNRRLAVNDCHASLGLEKIETIVHPSELWAESIEIHKTRRTSRLKR